MAFALSREIGPRGATAVAVTPGWLRSELMLDAYKRAHSKASGHHTSTAECGCQVVATAFSDLSVTYGIDRCTSHALDPHRKR